MKFVLAVLSFTVLAGTAQFAKGSDHADAAAQSAAVAWLVLIDAGNYSASWNAASSLFRQHVSQSQWQTAAAGARVPFGALKSRKLQSATFTRSVPGAPDGEYVVVTFASSFENKASAMETVTPMLDADGTWRVSGYYIR
jgi:hypothetical protein